jgi:hypothetical protein
VIACGSIPFIILNPGPFFFIILKPGPVAVACRRMILSPGWPLLLRMILSPGWPLLLLMIRRPGLRSLFMILNPASILLIILNLLSFFMILKSDRCLSLLTLLLGLMMWSIFMILKPRKSSSWWSSSLFSPWPFLTRLHSGKLAHHIYQNFFCLLPKRFDFEFKKYQMSREYVLSYSSLLFPMIRKFKFFKVTWLSGKLMFPTVLEPEYSVGISPEFHVARLGGCCSHSWPK